jgi:hypothetical protein
MEERMKSVDRDFDRSGIVKLIWVCAYAIAALGALCVLGKILEIIHLRGLAFITLLHFLALLIVFLCPMIISLLFKRYIRSALKENLVSARVVNNCEYFIGILLMFAYFAILQFATWN